MTGEKLPAWQADRLATLLDALGGVSIGATERESLSWLAGFELATVERIEQQCEPVGLPLGQPLAGHAAPPVVVDGTLRADEKVQPPQSGSGQPNRPRAMASGVGS